MLWFYSGTPGSGKSFHVAKDMFLKLGTKKQAVISTVDIDLTQISKGGKRKVGNFVYKPITEITPAFLYEYAMRNHVKGKEGQTLVILDECQIIFNPREFSKTGRLDWINFFTQHRHLGFNFILISQFDRLIDRQIRSLFEYEVKHRKVNNYGILFFLPFTCFFAITYWYGVKEVCSREFFIYNKKYAKVYDSYVMFDKFMAENKIPIDEAAPEAALHVIVQEADLQACIEEANLQVAVEEAVINIEVTETEPLHSLEVEVGVGGSPRERERFAVRIVSYLKTFTHSIEDAHIKP